MRLAFDLEADGLYDTATQIWCIVAKDLDSGNRFTWSVEESDSWKDFMKQVLDGATALIGHNIIDFDIPMLKKHWGWEPEEHVEIIDTLVMSRLLNPDRRKPPVAACKGGPHSLEAWGYRVGKGKPDHEDWSVFSPAMLERCDADVDITILTHSALSGEMVGHDWTEALRLEYKMAGIMSRQERHGILFDDAKAREYVQWLTDRIQAIDETLVPKLPATVKRIGTVPINNPFLKTGGYRKQTKDYLDEAFVTYTDTLVGGPFSRILLEPFNLGSTEKVKDYLLAHGWKPENWNISKTTGLRTSPKLEGEFEGVDGELPRLVKERITWRHRRSQIEGWLSSLRDDGRLPAGANPCGTNTGRMRHNTVVNIPKANRDKKTGELIWDTTKQKDIFGTQMRSLFICPEDFMIVGHDASGLELRMLAHYMDDPAFTEQILHGDIHDYNRIAAGLPDRDAAKTFIYAFNYGAGDAKLGSIVGGDASDGAELRAKFLSSLPKLEKLISSVKRAAGKGFLKGLDGRKVMMRIDDRGRVATHKALNTLLQSAGAVVMKASCVELWEQVAKHDILAYKILDMHDEGQSEVFKDHVELYQQLAVQSIITAGEMYNLSIPLAAEAKVGRNLSETH